MVHSNYENENIAVFDTINVLENGIREKMPDILSLLLIDRTLSNSRSKKYNLGK